MTIPHSLYSLKHIEDNTTLGTDFAEQWISTTRNNGFFNYWNNGF